MCSGKTRPKRASYENVKEQSRRYEQSRLHNDEPGSMRAWYVETVGYDPVMDDPTLTLDQLRLIRKAQMNDGGRALSPSSNSTRSCISSPLYFGALAGQLPYCDSALNFKFRVTSIPAKYRSDWRKACSKSRI